MTCSAAPSTSSAATPAAGSSDRADASYAALLKYADDLEEAQRRLLALLAEARASADLSSIAYTLAHLPHDRAVAGAARRARQFAEEHLDVAEQGSLAALAGQARFNLGHVLAHEGRLDEAGRRAGHRARRGHDDQLGPAANR